jgi:putative flavoprotein involved in K+ transport
MRGPPRMREGENPMRCDVVIIGGGQAGLAMSRCLEEHGVDHVVLERGRVGERWRSQSWASLRLLTPNWLNTLPGAPYAGPDPDGYMSAEEFAAQLDGFAGARTEPVRTGVLVRAVSAAGGEWQVTTDQGSWAARAVVIATGACGTARVPALAERLDRPVRQLHASGYRSPSELPAKGVLVVGASASGLQIAEEIHRSGRPVTLSVGSHTRLPRRYRGRDIFAWLEALGILDERSLEGSDLARLRGQPSLQLVGDGERRMIDLGTLRQLGVKVAGRLVAAEGHRIELDDSLMETTGDAQRRLDRLLQRIDASSPSRSGAGPADPPSPLELHAPAGHLDLERSGIGAVVWATGYRPSYPFLRVPLLDEWGEIRHEGGVTPAVGLYALGLRHMRRRSSSFIRGCGRDAEELVPHIIAGLEARPRFAA